MADDAKRAQKKECRRKFINLVKKYKNKYQLEVQETWRLKKLTSVPNMHKVAPTIAPKYRYVSLSQQDVTDDVFITDNDVTYMDLFVRPPTEQVKGKKDVVGKKGGRVSKVEVDDEILYHQAMLKKLGGGGIAGLYGTRADRDPHAKTQLADIFARDPDLKEGANLDLDDDDLLMEDYGVKVGWKVRSKVLNKARMVVLLGMGIASLILTAGQMAPLFECSGEVRFSFVQ